MVPLLVPTAGLYLLERLALEDVVASSLGSLLSLLLGGPESDSLGTLLVVLRSSFLGIVVVSSATLGLLLLVLLGLLLLLGLVG